MHGGLADLSTGSVSVGKAETKFQTYAMLEVYQFHTGTGHHILIKQVYTLYLHCSLQRTINLHLKHVHNSVSKRKKCKNNVSKLITAITMQCFNDVADVPQPTVPLHCFASSH